MSLQARTRPSFQAELDLNTVVDTLCVFSSRIKKDEGQGKERCHTKSMMSSEVNERIKNIHSTCVT